VHETKFISPFSPSFTITICKELKYLPSSPPKKKFRLDLSLCQGKKEKHFLLQNVISLPEFPYFPSTSTHRGKVNLLIKRDALPTCKVNRVRCWPKEEKKRQEEGKKTTLSVSFSSPHRRFSSLPNSCSRLAVHRCMFTPNNKVENTYKSNAVSPRSQLQQMF